MSGNVEKLSVALTPEMMAMVKAAVERGDYASTSEVIRDALRGWGAEQKQREAAIAELRALIQEGIDSGPSLNGPATMEALRKRIEAMRN
jgi:antitoxin ParD1/3/4